MIRTCIPYGAALQTAQQTMGDGREKKKLIIIIKTHKNVPSGKVDGARKSGIEVGRDEHQQTTEETKNKTENYFGERRKRP